MTPPLSSANPNAVSADPAPGEVEGPPSPVLTPYPQTEGARAADMEVVSQAQDSTESQPPQGSEISPVVQPLTTVQDAAGNTFDEGDLPPGAVVTPLSSPAAATDGAAETSPSADAIALAAGAFSTGLPEGHRYQSATGGKPAAKARFHTPKPPDLGVR